MNSESRRGNEYLPGSGLHRPDAADQSDPCGRRLSAEQRRALQDVRRRLAPYRIPREFFRNLVAHLDEVLGAKVGVAGKRGTSWTVVAESRSSPPIWIATHGSPHPFDRLTAATAPVQQWASGGRNWTLVALSSGIPAVVLMIEGDWTPCAFVFLDLVRTFIASNRAESAPSDGRELIAQLARSLADTVGLTSVGEILLHHVVQIVPSGMASVAVAGTDGELSIVATHGYPLALVDHLRIPPGSGVIGGVHLSRLPLLVPDVHGVPGHGWHRSRYRTSSFAAVPILAGGESLGVISVTDRLTPGPYTAGDLSAIRALAPAAALAIGRERVWREAQAYAQAAIVDPVSGLFNRRYFQARLDEELQRAIRQLTSVALLMIDLDGFKSINDRFGHLAGDLVIRDISEILRRSVRIFDVCTRFGGEEFAVMMPGGSAESAGAMAERIRHRVELYHRTEPDVGGLRVTASIGVAVSPPGATARDLIDRADRALYHAKKAGKNRVSTAGDDGTMMPSDETLG